MEQERASRDGHREGEQRGCQSDRGRTGVHPDGGRRAGKHHQDVPDDLEWGEPGQQLRCERADERADEREMQDPAGPSGDERQRVHHERGKGRYGERHHAHEHEQIEA